MSEGTSAFAGWPPALSPAQQQALALLATTYALAHGLVYLPTTPTIPSSSVIHAPITILPTPFPRHHFNRAKRLQNTYNVLYARVTRDVPFLDRVMGEEGVGKVDEFIGTLWSGWKQLREEGLAQVRPACGLHICN